MTFTIRAKILCDAVDRVYLVASHASVPEHSRCVTLYLNANEAILMATDGTLSIRLTLSTADDPLMQITAPGTVTVQAADLRLAAHHVGSAGDHLVGLASAGEMLTIADAATSLSSQIRCETTPAYAPWPPQSVPTFTMPGNLFRDAVTAVSRYRSRKGYRIRDRLLCLDCVGDRMRCVCGEAARFAIFSAPLPYTCPATRYLISAAHAERISQVVDPDGDVELSLCRNKLLIQSGERLKLWIGYDPDAEYIRYEKHLCLADNPDLIIDVPRIQLYEVARSLRRTRDPAYERSNGEPQVTALTTGTGGITLTTAHGINQSQHSIPAAIYMLNGDEHFSAEYHTMFLEDISRPARGRFVRLYLRRESRVVVAEVADLHGDSAGPPLLYPNDDDQRLQFLFAHITRYASQT